LGAGNRDVALRVFKASNGGYWVAGYSNRPVTASVPGGFAITVSKLTSAGALDSSYETDGRVILNSVFVDINDVAMDANQNLIFVGSISDGASGTDVAVMKVLSTGQVDTTFSLGLSVLLDGSRIVVGGARLWLAPSDFDFAVAAYKQDAGLPFANGFE
jgi:hypothetical protein